MRALRNIAIIALLALIVAVVPGGDNAADALLALISMLFLALIVAGGYQLYRQYRLPVPRPERRTSGRCSSARSGRSC